MGIRYAVSAALIFATWAVLGGCSGKVQNDSPGGHDGALDGGLECVNGSSKPADDGCNTCACTDGQWACTEKACPTPICSEGDSRLAGDGCNTCSCVGGQWGCTALDCAPPACTPGDVRAQDDCNSCWCDDTGQWACTNWICDYDARPSCGGFAGNTCGIGEFCAYTEGELCGGADASSVCVPIPDTCPKDLHPVCGCNNKTYDNACLAAMAGTGVMYSHGCENPCAGSDPSGNGHPIVGCPCNVPASNAYCCTDDIGDGVECSGGLWSTFYDYPCGGWPPGADAGPPPGVVSGTVRCEP